MGCYLTPALRIGEWQEHDYFTQEHFGPDLVLIPIQNEQEGLRRINSLDYGLAAAIFCKDQEQFDNLASRLRCGVVNWNHAMAARTIREFDERVYLPLNGFKGPKKY